MTKSQAWLSARAIIIVLRAAGANVDNLVTKGYEKQYCKPQTYNKKVRGKETAECCHVTPVVILLISGF